ncbi:hypothetical protein ACWGH5_25415 [Streptomyces sp. NPDC054864]
MRHRRVRNLVLLAAVASSFIALATPASAAEQEAANPPPLPHIDSLITEGVSVEGPLINNIGLPTLR